MKKFIASVLAALVLSGVLGFTTGTPAAALSAADENGVTCPSVPDPTQPNGGCDSGTPDLEPSEGEGEGDLPTDVPQDHTPPVVQIGEAVSVVALTPAAAPARAVTATPTFTG